MFDRVEIELTYIRDHQEYNVSFPRTFENEDVQVLVERDKDGCQENLKLTMMPEDKIIIKQFNIIIPYSYQKEQKIFVNSYQSWTDSREMFIDEKMKKPSKLTAWITKKSRLKEYGDYIFKNYTGKRGIFHGYTYSYIRSGEVFDFIGSLTEKSGFTIIEHNTKKHCIVISKECRGLKVTSQYTPFQIYYAKGNENKVFDGYFSAMKIHKPECGPSVGWSSWYNYHQKIDQNTILENIDNFKNYNKKIDIVQIDDGYQTAVGDWFSIDPVKFPKGMKFIADRIKQNGYKAGIWLAPFVCETKSEVYCEKKDWILKDHQGKPVSAGGNWSGFYTLDFYNPEVRVYIKKVLSVVLNDWGYDMVKLDFLYAVCLLPRADKTRGQIMTEAMEFLRKCAGDKLILGCGVPLGPAFGQVDYCRIGCDVSRNLGDKFYMRFLLGERALTRNAIMNTIGWHQLNNRAFMNNPDVFCLRRENNCLNNNQKETLAFVNNLFGSLLFTSDNLKNYSDRQFELFDKTIRLKNRSILRVEYNRNRLIEITYKEEGEQYQLLINLNRKTVNYTDKLNGTKYCLPPFGNKIINLSSISDTVGKNVFGGHSVILSK